MGRDTTQSDLERTASTNTNRAKIRGVRVMPYTGRKGTYVEDTSLEKYTQK